MFGMKWLLEFMHTPKDIFADAYTYIMIICAGIVAQMLYNLLASLLRAIGNSKVPLYFLILSALLNILLDLPFSIVIIKSVIWSKFSSILSETSIVAWYSDTNSCRSLKKYFLNTGSNPAAGSSDRNSFVNGFL